MGFQKLGWWRSPAVYLVMDAVVFVVVLVLVVKVGLLVCEWEGIRNL
jgi:hypothetical protein